MATGKPANVSVPERPSTAMFSAMSNVTVFEPMFDVSDVNVIQSEFFDDVHCTLAAVVTITEPEPPLAANVSSFVDTIGLTAPCVTV